MGTSDSIFLCHGVHKWSRTASVFFFIRWEVVETLFSFQKVLLFPLWHNILSPLFKHFALLNPCFQSRQTADTDTACPACGSVCLLLTQGPSVLGCELAWLSDVNICMYTCVCVCVCVSTWIENITSLFSMLLLLFMMWMKATFMSLLALLLLSLMDYVHFAMHFLSWLHTA